MIQYTIEYDFHGGKRSKTTDNIFQLSQWLEEAMNDKQLTPGTIEINTEEKK